MELTFIDFFSGIGGFRLGMELAGHICLGHCEIDKYANKSYYAMHKPKEDEWFEEDITEVRARELPIADVWCAGFPCQDISIGGSKIGFKGSRSSLFFRITELIRDTEEKNRPKYIFLENVKNLLSVNRGYDFLKLQVELAEVGYDCEWQVLNSKDFGVPQNRERVFIVGHSRKECGSKIFPIRPSSRTIKISQVKAADYRYDSGIRIRDSGVAPCLCAKMNRMENENDLSSSIFIVGNTNPSGHGSGGNVISVEGLSPTLTINKGSGIKILVKENTKQGYTIAEDGDSINLAYINSSNRRARVGKQRANTLTTGCNQGVLLNGKVRRITPKEAFRLQGWPDDYYERAASVCSNTQLYKQAGNGVTVPVVYEIAKRLK